MTIGSPLVEDPPGSLDPIEPGHLHVEKCKVGLLGPRELDRLFAVFSLGADLEAGALQQRAQVHADDRLVLGDQQPHVASLGRSGARRRSRARPRARSTRRARSTPRSRRTAARPPTARRPEAGRRRARARLPGRGARSPRAGRGAPPTGGRRLAPDREGDERHQRYSNAGQTIRLNRSSIPSTSRSSKRQAFVGEDGASSIEKTASTTATRPKTLASPLDEPKMMQNTRRGERRRGARPREDCSPPRRCRRWIAPTLPSNARHRTRCRTA